MDASREARNPRALSRQWILSRQEFLFQLILMSWEIKVKLAALCSNSLQHFAFGCSRRAWSTRSQMCVNYICVMVDHWARFEIAYFLWIIRPIHKIEELFLLRIVAGHRSDINQEEERGDSRPPGSGFLESIKITEKFIVQIVNFKKRSSRWMESILCKEIVSFSLYETIALRWSQAARICSLIGVVIKL